MTVRCGIRRPIWKTEPTNKYIFLVLTVCCADLVNSASQI
jgi:hypothetical protein